MTPQELSHLLTLPTERERRESSEPRRLEEALYSQVQDRLYTAALRGEKEAFLRENLLPEGLRTRLSQEGFRVKYMKNHLGSGAGFYKVSFE